MKILFALLCAIALFTLPTQAQDFVPVPTFDASEFLGDHWYENMYADTLPDALIGCTSYAITSGENGAINMDYAYNRPGIDGDMVVRKIILTQDGETGRFAANNTSTNKIAEIIVLDHADNFDWIAFADTTGDVDSQYISVIAKTPRNLDAIASLIKLAGDYNLTSQHLDLQDETCDYDTILTAIKP